MAISINDLDDDDVMQEESSQQQLELNVYIQEPQNLEEDDFLADFLRTRGIDDASKIKFEDDNNLIVERDWKDLTKEEKFNILNTPLETQQDENNSLSDEEIQLLAQIRQSNMTPSQFIQSIKGEEVVQEPQYAIDSYSDDELYLLDLENRVGKELSEDEEAQALNWAKQNEELYKKQVEGIRKEYKQKEDLKLQQELAQREQEDLEAYNQFLDSVIESITNFDSVGNMDLNFSDSDRNELAEFMLSRDEAGNNYLWQALQDPDTLVRAAWFILNGDDAFDSISEYFINLIKLVSENQYKKGYEEGKNGKGPSRPKVVINNLNNKSSFHTIKDIDNLDDDED